MFETRNDLPESTRATVIKMLNERRSIDDATKLNDADTADLFTEISRGVDKLLWMVEAHIQDV